MHQISYLGSSNSTYFVWVPSTSDIKPIIGDQISLGYYRNKQISGFSYSAEAYIKNSKHNISYFTDSLTSETTLSLQTELVSSQGKSYGLELYAALNKKDFTGHISYTLSRSLRQADEINNGNWYSSNYDRPHNFALNLNYKLSSKFRLNVSWLYSTGMPSSVAYEGLEKDDIEFNINKINTYRLPDYHRLDFGLVYENKSKPLKRFQSSWSFNIYNVYNRNNNYLHEGLNQTSNASYNNTSLYTDYGIMPAISYRLTFDFNGNSCFSRFVNKVENKINELFPPLDN